MKSFRHFERALAGEHRSQADVEAGTLPASRRSRAGATERGEKRFAGAYVPEETHASLNALAKADYSTLSDYLRKIFAEEIERRAGLLAKRN